MRKASAEQSKQMSRVVGPAVLAEPITLGGFSEADTTKVELTSRFRLVR